ncbi:putative ALA-interacting subunit 2 isoform X2 [Cryptomeria japonica]|uniref:putative ALA-interacting subunit 2 isoform X2 n=1 Tax=Cryptomeria japonica TaxID=3369 RepID=UPI0027D9E324|nr:putative ALA-interacting subunit 2 isoform X2 [Cryptomeria japonica]
MASRNPTNPNHASSSQPANSRETNPQPRILLRKPKYNRFTQQELPGCRPFLTPQWIITIFMLVGVIFIPIGVGALLASRSVVEIVHRYETECIPEIHRINKLAYIQNDSISKDCSKVLKVQKHMKAPIYIYYQLDHFYQNHRRYVKSRSNEQLLYGLRDNSTKSSCGPETNSNGVPIVPCGLIAWSLFNDTYKFSLFEDIELHVNKTNIAWKSDREHKFGKKVYPFNFQNGSLIGGAKLDPSVPLSDQEDLIVWMRISALPTFRKLYGRIEVDLEADDYITVEIQNNYNTYSFGGKKSLVLSTTSWLGGKNDTLGKAYVVTGILCILLAVVFFLSHIIMPSRFDPKNISGHKYDTVDQ